MTSVWQRLKRVWQANAHASVDQMEQPEAMLNQLQRELVTAVAKAKGALAKSRVWQTRLDDQIGQQQGRLAIANESAKRAVSDGNDEMARQAIARRQQCSAQIEIFEQQRRRAGQLLQQQESQLDALKQKLAELRNKRALLLSRERFARAVTDGDSQQYMPEPIDAVLERIEDDVTWREAQADSMTLDSLDEAPCLDDYLSNQAIEDELQQLKQAQQQETSS